MEILNLDPDGSNSNDGSADNKSTPTAYVIEVNIRGLLYWGQKRMGKWSLNGVADNAYRFAGKDEAYASVRHLRLGPDAGVQIVGV